MTTAIYSKKDKCWASVHGWDCSARRRIFLSDDIPSQYSEMMLTLIAVFYRLSHCSIVYTFITRGSSSRRLTSRASCIFLPDYSTSTAITLATTGTCFLLCMNSALHTNEWVALLVYIGCYSTFSKNLWRWLTLSDCIFILFAKLWCSKVTTHVSKNLAMEVP